MEPSPYSGYPPPAYTDVRQVGRTRDRHGRDRGGEEERAGGDWEEERVNCRKGKYMEEGEMEKRRERVEKGGRERKLRDKETERREKKKWRAGERYKEGNK